MKRINEYIYERNVKNLLDIEFLSNIFEERGSIKDHLKFARFLSDKLVENITKGINKIAFSYDDLAYGNYSKDCVFYNVLILNFIHDKNLEKMDSSYKIDKDDAKYVTLNHEKNYIQNLNIVEITIYSPEIYDDSETYVELIDHELLHAYDEARSRKNGPNTLYKAILKSGYQALVTYNNDDTDMDKMVKTIIYLLSDIEKNAYISQFKTILNDEFYNDDNDAVEKLLNSGLYKTYRLVKNNIRFLEQNINSEAVNYFCDSYRKVTKERIEDIKKQNIDFEDLIKNIKPNLSNNKIIKKLVDRWNKFEHKLYQHTKIKIQEQHRDFCIDSLFKTLKDFKEEYNKSK